MRTATFVRTTATAVLAGAALLGGAGPAGACGGLIGENGSISLVRTSTLAAWHDGIEHYVTSFEFSGTGESVGSIIPLPGVPTDGRAGRRVDAAAPPDRGAATRRGPLRGTAGASVGRQRRARSSSRPTVDALDITVLAGGADEVGQWALDNGFFLTPDAPEVLDFYAAAERGLPRRQVRRRPRRRAGPDVRSGHARAHHDPDRAPVGAAAHPRPRPPGRGPGAGRRVPAHRRGARPPRRRRGPRPSSAAWPPSDSLLFDLRTDRGMEWVPEDMWLTHLTLAESAQDLDYDLSVGAGGRGPSARGAGLVLPRSEAPPDASSTASARPSTPPATALATPGRTSPGSALGAGGVLLAVAGALQLRAVRTRART